MLGVGDVIPDHLVEYVQEIVTTYLTDYDEFIIYKPMTMPFDSRTLSNNPYGEFINYVASPLFKNNEISKRRNKI